MKIGIDLGGSHIAIGVIDSNGRIEEKIEKRLLKKDKINIEESVENYIIENVEKLKKKYNIRKIGISVPGTVNKDKIVKSGVHVVKSNYVDSPIISNYSGISFNT